MKATKQTGYVIRNAQGQVWVSNGGSECEWAAPDYAGVLDAATYPTREDARDEIGRAELTGAKIETL